MKRLSVLLILVACAFAQKPDKPLKNGLYAIFNTELGKFTAQLYEKDTPNSVKMFAELAQGTLASRDPKTNAMVKRPGRSLWRLWRSIARFSGALPTRQSEKRGFYERDTRRSVRWIAT